MQDFDGRTVLVTGASGGIGGATVRKLIGRGADVIASARTPESLEPVVRETGARAVPFDLTSEESIAAAIGDLELYGVVNCGGFGGEIATPQDTDIAVFDKVMAINARGALLVTKYAARTMIRLGAGGSIVNVSSQASLVALNGHISYGSSKAALDNITRVSALELGQYGIRVNSVNPTVVMTEMSAFYWGRPEIGEPFLADAAAQVGHRGRHRRAHRLPAQRRGRDDHRGEPADRRRLQQQVRSRRCPAGPRVRFVPARPPGSVRARPAPGSWPRSGATRRAGDRSGAKTGEPQGWGCRGAGVPGCRGAGVPGCRGAGVPACRG